MFDLLQRNLKQNILCRIETARIRLVVMISFVPSRLCSRLRDRLGKHNCTGWIVHYGRNFAATCQRTLIRVLGGCFRLRVNRIHWHVVAKLLLGIRRSEVDYQDKVLPNRKGVNKEERPSNSTQATVLVLTWFIIQIFPFKYNKHQLYAKWPTSSFQIMKMGIINSAISVHIHISGTEWNRALKIKIQKEQFIRKQNLKGYRDSFNTSRATRTQTTGEIIFTAQFCSMLIFDWGKEYTFLISTLFV